MGKTTWIGLAKPDDPIYSSGPIVSFRPQLTPSTVTSPIDMAETTARAKSNSADEKDGARAESIRRE